MADNLNNQNIQGAPSNLEGASQVADQTVSPDIQNAVQGIGLRFNEFIKTGNDAGLGDISDMPEMSSNQTPDSVDIWGKGLLAKGFGEKRAQLHKVSAFSRNLSANELRTV